MSASDPGLENFPFQGRWREIRWLTVADAAAEADCLSTQEQETLQALPYEGRQQEWLGGRLAAKTLVEQEWVCPRERVEIHADEAGIPRLWSGVQRLPWELSIAHESGLSLAGIAPHPLGVDMEALAARNADIAHKIATRLELARIRSELETKQPGVAETVLLSIKEAALKCTGTGLNTSFLQMKLAKLQAVSHGQGIRCEIRDQATDTLFQGIFALSEQAVISIFY